jgi:hypothetical protein
MSLTIEVILHVPVDKLSGVLNSDLTSSLIRSVRQLEEVQLKTRTHRFVNGVRNKGISGRDLALQVLGSAKRPFSYKELAETFQAKGFAPNSVSPVLSILVAEKKAQALGAGLYAMPGFKPKK